MGNLRKLSQAEKDALIKSKTCAHPEDQRTQIGFGIYCDLCKYKVDDISLETFTKNVEDMLSSLPWNK